MPTDLDALAGRLERWARALEYTGGDAAKVSDLAAAARALRAAGHLIRALYIGERGDVDGAELQDIGTAAGVLVPTKMDAPCARSEDETCACYDYGAEFPTTCYRVAPVWLEGEDQ